MSAFPGAGLMVDAAAPTATFSGVDILQNATCVFEKLYRTLWYLCVEYV